jgi:hypothetical protein
MATVTSWRWWIGPLVLVVASVARIVDAVHRHPALSPFDEYMYADYVSKVFQEGWVSQGEETGDFARELASCRGISPFGLIGQCGVDYSENDSVYPYNGVTIADQHPPTYFVLVRLGAWLFRLLGVDDVYTSMRLTGMVFLAAGVVLIYALLRALRVGPVLATLVPLAYLGTPVAYWSSAFISNDAPAVLVGAGSLLIVVLAARGRISIWWLVVAAVVAAAFKTTLLFGVLLAGLFWVVVRMRGTGSSLDGDPDTDGTAATAPTAPSAPAGSWGRRLWTAAAPVVAAIAAAGLIQGIWVVIRTASAVGEWPGGKDAFLVPTIGRVFVESTLFLDFTLPGDNTGQEANNQLAGALAWLAVAGLVAGSLFTVAAAPIIRDLARTTLVVALLAGPALMLFSIVVLGNYFSLHARYGLPLVPAFLAVGTALLIRQRWVVVLVGLFAVAVYSSSYLGVLT